MHGSIIIIIIVCKVTFHCHNLCCAICNLLSTLIPYSGYNLRGAIFANHQISHLAVIFAIIKFANHRKYRVTFCVNLLSYYVWTYSHIVQGCLVWTYEHIGAACSVRSIVVVSNFQCSHACSVVHLQRVWPLWYIVTLTSVWRLWRCIAWCLLYRIHGELSSFWAAGHSCSAGEWLVCKCKRCRCINVVGVLMYQTVHSRFPTAFCRLGCPRGRSIFCLSVPERPSSQASHNIIQVDFLV